MTESASLRNARKCLAKAEASFASPDGLAQLDEGLALLDELIEADAGEQLIARNLAATYATRMFGHVSAAITTDRAVPEPTLEHYFKLMLAFDAGDFRLPDESRSLKVAVARRLIELIYQGYPADVRRKALERLDDIVGDR